jgi:ABC-type oligopeptide transport system ATPase subunit
MINELNGHQFIKAMKEKKERKKKKDPMMIFQNKKSVGKSNGDKTRKYKTK